jgi:phage N-6-adenine-methyltransferase
VEIVSHQESLDGRSSGRKSKSVGHLSIITEKDEYGTPYYTYDMGCNIAGFVPKIDVCGSEINHKCSVYFTEKDNALSKQWNQDFWMNPPYSKIEQFMDYAWKQHRKYNVNGLILVFAKTGTKWWHKFVESKINDTKEVERHFILGRIRFLDEFGKQTKNSAPYDSAWVIYRKMNL